MNLEELIQSSPYTRYCIYKTIRDTLNKHFKHNIQCFNSNNKKITHKDVKSGDITLGDVLPVFRRIGSPSAYGVIYLACVNKLILSERHRKKYGKGDADHCMDKCEMINFGKNCVKKAINLRKKDSNHQRVVKKCASWGRKHEKFLLAVKLQSLTSNEIKDLQKIIKINKYIDPWNSKSLLSSLMWREIRATKLITKFIEYSICPNVPILYENYLCNNCGVTKDNKVTVYPEEAKKSKPCIVIVNELSSGDFKSWTETKRDESAWLSAYFQIFAGIIAMQLNFGMIHYDFHWGNQLYSDVADDYYLYNLYDTNDKLVESFAVPTRGSLFKLWDFGMVYAEHGLKGVEINLKTRQVTTKHIWFNDIVHILNAAIYWAGSQGTKPAPKTIKIWAENCIAYIENEFINNKNKRSNKKNKNKNKKKNNYRINDVVTFIQKVFSEEALNFVGITDAKSFFVIKKRKKSNVLTENGRVRNCTQEWNLKRNKKLRKEANGNV